MITCNFVDDVNSLLALQHASYTYQITAVTTETDLTLPAAGVLKTVELTDRDAILTRSDVTVVGTQQQQHFATHIVVPVGLTGQKVNVFRGWESVDVQDGGQVFRVINTHLETADDPLSASVQLVQATELLRGPARYAGPTILLGDFNANADAVSPASLTYRLLVGAGFSDAWSQTNPNDPGYTWPLPPSAANNQRIDLVLMHGGVSAQSMYLVGTTTIGSTGIYPSDHAGVVASLVLPTPTVAATNSADSLLASFYAVADPIFHSSSHV